MLKLNNNTSLFRVVKNLAEEATNAKSYNRTSSYFFESGLVYKKIIYFFLMLSFVLFNHVSFGETLYYLSREEVTNQEGVVIKYIYKEPIQETFAKHLINFGRTVYDVDRDEGIISGETLEVNVKNGTNETPTSTASSSSGSSSTTSTLKRLESYIDFFSESTTAKALSPEQLEVLKEEAENDFNDLLDQKIPAKEATLTANLANDFEINLKKDYYKLPDNVDPSDDAYVNTLTPIEQSHLYVATIQDIQNRDGDIGRIQAEQIVNEHSADEHISKLEIYDELMQIATDTTNARMHELVDPMSSNTSLPYIASNVDSSNGVSAGDTRHRLNEVWARGIFGTVKQGNTSEDHRFNGNTYGGTIGIDGRLNNCTIVGISYTRMYGDFKYKMRSGNKANTISDIMSVYGITNINDKFALQGLFAAGKITAKQKSRRQIDIDTYKTAIGKFDVDTYTMEAILNYKVANNSYFIMPHVGVRYNKNFDSGYSEYGTGVHNFRVLPKNHTSWALLAGIQMKKSYNISDKIILTPGIHGQIDHYVYNRASDTQIHKQWDSSIHSITTPTSAYKTGYNLGGTVALGYKNKEILMTYNTHLRGKYNSHQGSVRFKYIF